MMFSNRNKFGIVAGAALLTLFGCNEEVSRSTSNSPENAITFGIVNGNGDENGKGHITRAENGSCIAGEGESFIIPLVSEDLKDTLQLLCEVSDYSYLANGSESSASAFSSDEEMAINRGVPVTDDNLKEVFSQIGISAWYQDQQIFTQDEYLTWNRVDRTGQSSVSEWKTTVNTYYWPGSEVKLDFWAWCPKNLESQGVSDFNINNSSKLTFQYTLPSHNSGNDDAIRQKELLFAYKQACQSDNNGRVNLHLKHALSCIKVNVGKNVAGKVNSVSLVNVASKGTCEFITTSDTPSFSWTVEGKETYTQAFNVELNENSSKTEITKDAEGTDFMMLPQTLSTTETEKQLIVTVDFAGAKREFKAKLPEGGKWEPGKLYTYTIGLNGTIDVDVTDEISGNVKQNVEITNTGTVPEYIRATIVANWYNDEGDIVAPWKMTDGTFEKLAADADKWYKGNDGYYYYRYPVPGGEKIPEPLFNTYTQPTTPPVSGAHLEMKIIVQAIAAIRANAVSAWGIPEAELR